MPPTVALTLRTAAAVLAVAALAGCATRYDAFGNRIYVWQFGQDTGRSVDYSNPRLPILPRQQPNFNLWETPTPYEFRDLSQYSWVAPPAPEGTAVAIGDNPACAVSCEPNASVALAAAGAVHRDGRAAPADGR